MSSISDSYKKGNKEFSKCNYRKALYHYLAVVKNRPNEAILRLRIAQCYDKLKAIDRAIESFLDLLNLYLKSGELYKAVAVCKRILFLDPDNTDMMHKLAGLFVKLKQ